MIETLRRWMGYPITRARARKAYHARTTIARLMAEAYATESHYLRHLLIGKADAECRFLMEHTGWDKV